MSKYVLTHVLVLLPLEAISMFMIKNAGKKKLFEKNRKKQSHAQVSYSFKCSFMLKNMLKKLAKAKLFKERSHSNVIFKRYTVRLHT